MRTGNRPVDSAVTLGNSSFRGVVGSKAQLLRVQEKIGGEEAVSANITNSFEEFFSKRKKKNRVVAEE